MRRYLTLVFCASLGACSVTPPVITINPDTNTVTTAPTPTQGTGPLVDAVNRLATDTADALNLACGKPVKDPLGCNFFTDLVNLGAALAAQQGGGSGNVGPEGVLTKVERIRIQLGQISDASNNPLMTKTLLDGMLWVQDTKKKAIAVPQQIRDLLVQIQFGLLA